MVRSVSDPLTRMAMPRPGVTRSVPMVAVLPTLKKISEYGSDSIVVVSVNKALLTVK